MRGQPQEQARASRRGGAIKAAFLFSPLLVISAFISQAAAEVRVVNAQGHHRMGDRDTREDAVRLATESAKRNALEQVATYLESITVVDGVDILKDEIHTYTAGLVLVLEQQTNTVLDGDTVVVSVDLVTRIDTEEVGRAIAALRENEDARVQLAGLKRENEQLQRDLDAANQALSSASTSDQAQEAAQHRQDILNRVQSNAIVSQAWTDWVLVSPVVYPYPWGGLAHTHALLTLARTLYPASPHVTIAQQVITTRQPPAPPQPPMPPAGGSSSRLHIPRHEIVPAPGSTGVRRTLNEITHRTPTGPPELSNRPGSGLTDGHRLDPLSPPHGGHQESHANVRRQQFLEPHGALSPTPAMRVPAPVSGPRQIPGGPPPVVRRLPPTINQAPPHLSPQVPLRPYQMAPRGSGSGHGNGGGGGKGGHGR